MSEIPLGLVSLAVLMILIVACVKGTLLKPEINASFPIILFASVIPTKVTPGDMMIVEAQIFDNYGIDSVEADMGGIETIKLDLVEGNLYRGYWREDWIVHNTEIKDYITTITATNKLGLKSYKRLEWSDPIYTESGKLSLVSYISKNEIKFGESLSISGNVFYDDKPIETPILIKINEEVFETSSNQFGAYSYKFTPTSPGDYTISIQAKYKGYATEGTTIIKVLPLSKESSQGLRLIAEPEKQKISLGESIKFSGEVYYGDKPLQIPIKVKINSEEFLIQTDSSGHFSFSYTPKEIGEYTITIQASKGGKITAATQVVTVIEVVKSQETFQILTTSVETTLTDSMKKWKDSLIKNKVNSKIFEKNNKYFAKLELDGITVEFQNFEKTKAHWDKTPILTKNANIKDFVNSRGFTLKDFIWIDSNGFLNEEDYDASIILPSTYSKVFYCTGSKESPNCFFIKKCSQSPKPCYEVVNGKTIVNAEHFSGAGGTVEKTMYMRSDQHIVNGLTAYVLNTTQSSSAKEAEEGGNLGAGCNDVNIGIRVWRRESDGTEYEITSGSPVAVVTRTADGEGMQNNTWTPPETNMNPTDSLVIRVYINAEGSYVERVNFTTEELGSIKLNSETWTVYYYTKRITANCGAKPQDDQTWGSFFWGNGTYNSSIVGINYTLATPFVDKPKTLDNDTLEEKTLFERNKGMSIRVNVTQAGGASQIDKVLITILNTTNSVIVNNETMTNISSITNGYTYEYNFTIPSDADIGTWTINIYANDTSNNWGSNTTTFEVIEYGWLNVTWTNSDINSTICTQSSPCTFDRYDTLTMRAIITCEGNVDAVCGDVYAGARYNDSTTTMKLINITEGAIPFYIVGGEGNNWTVYTNETEVNLGSSTFNAMTYMDDDSIAIAYQDISPYYGKFVVYNINGTIELSETEFNSNFTTEIGIKNIDDDSVIIAYDDSDYDNVEFIIYNVNGTNETPEIIVDSTNIQSSVKIDMLDTDSFVIAYDDNSNGNIKFIVYNINGTNETPITVIDSVGSDISVATIDSDSIALAYSSSTYNGTFVVYNINGTNETPHITFESSGSIDYTSISKVDSDSVFIAYKNSDDTYGKFVVYNINGTQETVKTTFNSDNTLYISTTTIDEDSVAISYRDAGTANYYGNFIIYNIDGTNETPEITFNKNSTGYTSIDFRTNYLVISYSDADESNIEFIVYKSPSEAQNPISLGTLSYGESVYATFIVNVTGTPGSIWKLDINTTSSYSAIQDNDTQDAYIQIAGLSASIGDFSQDSIKSLQSTTIFGSCNYIGGTASGVNITLQDNRTGTWSDVSTSGNVYANTTSYYIGSLSGQSQTYYWEITGNVSGDYNFRIKCNASGTTDAYSSEKNLTVNPWLNITWAVDSDINSTTCTPSSPCTFNQYNNFTMKATIQCIGGGCTNVFIGARYNDSTTTMKLINITEGAIPFYIIGVIAHSEGEYTGESFSLYTSTNSHDIDQNGTFFWHVNFGDWSVYKYFMNGTYTGDKFTCQGTQPFGVTTNNTFIWVTDGLWGNAGKVYKYFMNGTYTGDYFDTISDNQDPTGLANDGTYFYIGDDTSDKIFKYWMNGTYTGKNFSVSSQMSSPGGITTDGNYIWVAGENSNVYKYDINGNYLGYFSISDQDAYAFGVTQNETYIWVVGDDSDKVYKYWKGGIETPQNPISLGTLSYGKSVYATFIVNVTGTPGSIWKLDINSSSSTYSAIQDNDTEDAYILITGLGASIGDFSLNPITPPQKTIISGYCSYGGGTATGVNITLQDNRTGTWSDVSTSGDIYANTTSYYIGSLSGQSQTYYWEITGNVSGNYTFRIKCNATGVSDVYSSEKLLWVKQPAVSFAIRSNR